LEALALRKDNYHSTLKPKDSHIFGAFNQIVGPRRSRGEKSHKQRREKLSHPTGLNGPIIEKRSCRGNWEDLPLFNCLDVHSFVNIESLFIVFLFSPFLRKSQEEISLKGGGGCNTSWNLSNPRSSLEFYFKIHFESGEVPIRKVVRYFKTFTTIFYLKFFEFEKAPF
jgi:hypothetical protein